MLKRKKRRELKYSVLGLFFFCSIFVLSAQQSNKVKLLEQKRVEALKEIAITNKLLSETSKNAKLSLNRLHLLMGQIVSRKKMIDLLQEEIKELDKHVEETEEQIKKISKHIEKSKKDYVHSISLIKRHNKTLDKLLFILAADDFAQGVRRTRYLREYATWQKQQVKEIIEEQKKLKETKKDLDTTLDKKKLLVKESKEEAIKLRKQQEEKKQQVFLLNQKEKELSAQLRKKKKQAAELNRQIEKQITYEIKLAEDARRKTMTKRKSSDKSKKEEIIDEPKRDTYAMTTTEAKLSSSFAANKGRLPYPVTGSHVIVSAFGNQKHKELKYVRTNNNGIDIQTSANSDARSVFKGVITKIFSVPGYNTSVIVRHGNYLTVYCNISEVYVRSGERVNTGQKIGKIFTDKDTGDTVMHFQLWKEKSKQNPALWIR